MLSQALIVCSLLNTLLLPQKTAIVHPRPLSAQNSANVERLADAIYKAEGGAKTKYPYGILTRYKHTTPRQACINTIKHALKDWNKKGDFIEFLGSRYCPPKAHPLNKNWVKNVKAIYETNR